MLVAKEIVVRLLNNKLLFISASRIRITDHDAFTTHLRACSSREDLKCVFHRNMAKRIRLFDETRFNFHFPSRGAHLLPSKQLRRQRRAPPPLIGQHSRS